MKRIQATKARHWLAAQVLLWRWAERCGGLWKLGWRRWTTRPDGRVVPVCGDAWGTHWQWGALRLADWGCWLEEDGQALAYDVPGDRFLGLDRWSPALPQQSDWLPPARAWREFESPVVQLGGLESDWEWLTGLREQGLLTPEAVVAWRMVLGSRRFQAGWPNPGESYYRSSSAGESSVEI